MRDMVMAGSADRMGRWKLNFIEAVQALQDGLCEGIKPGKDANYAKLYDGGKDSPCLAWSSGVGETDIPIHCILGDWQPVNPKPQTEKIPIVRWLFIPTATVQVDEPTVCDPAFWVKLTGEMVREIKPKVKRREEITPSTGAQWRSVHADSQIPDDCLIGNFFFEWTEE